MSDFNSAYVNFFWPEQPHIIYLTAFTLSFLHRMEKGHAEGEWLQLTGQKRENCGGCGDGGRFFRWHWAGTAGGEGAKRAPQGAVSITMTYSTDEARIVPAVAQGLQKPIPGVDLKITAMAFGAEHLLIVCRDKGDERRGNRGERGNHQNNSNELDSKELLSSSASGQASSTASTITIYKHHLTFRGCSGAAVWVLGSPSLIFEELETFFFG